MYIIIEIQANSENAAIIANSYTDEILANSDFYNKCASAVLSNVPIHTIKMCNETGADIPGMCKTFFHGIQT